MTEAEKQEMAESAKASLKEYITLQNQVWVSMLECVSSQMIALDVNPHAFFKGFLRELEKSQKEIKKPTVVQ